MDQKASISPQDLYARLGPLVLDVRRAPAFEKADCLIASSLRRTPENVQAWQQALPRNRQVVAYCVHGHEVSQGVVAALRTAGIDTAYLDGGIEAWIACVYRKPKPGHNGDEVRQGSGVN